MKPTLQTSRQIATTILTVIGVGLFVVVSVQAVHQIADRRYTDGKQRVVSSAVSNLPTTANDTVVETARYAPNLTPLPASPASHNDVVSTSPFTPLTDTPARTTGDSAKVVTASYTTTVTDGSTKDTAKPDQEQSAPAQATTDDNQRLSD